MNGAFTLAELRGWLVGEIVQAQQGFERAQVAARLAPGGQGGDAESMAAWLAIDRLQLQFSLLEVRAPWPQRVWRALRRAFGAADDRPITRFRFSVAEAETTSAVRISCELRRQVGGQYTLQPDPLVDAD